MHNFIVILCLGFVFCGVCLAGLYVDHMGKQHNLCPQHSTSNEKEVERVLSMGGTIINNRVREREQRGRD